MATASSRLLAFIQIERQHYAGDGNNLFAFALGQAARYESFLEIILDRHHALCEEFRQNQTIQHVVNEAAKNEGPEGGSITMTPQHVACMKRFMEMSPLLQFESEAFYLFAKILLDKLAQFLEHYFRPFTLEGRNTIRGLSLASHDRLTKCFGKYISALELDCPSKFHDMLTDLKSRISDFRDYEIAHETNPRVAYLTSWAGTGEPRLHKMAMFQRDITVGPTSAESETPTELMELLRVYMDSIRQIIELNRSKSSFNRDAS